MFSCLQDDSFYVVEDAYDFMPGCTKDSWKPMDFFKNMIDFVNNPVARYRCPEKTQMSNQEATSYGIHFYNNIVLIHKKNNTYPLLNKPLPLGPGVKCCD